ncbi:MAG: CDP-diacylglycerol--glycerol-3-phosphate 3-phosphatidyltransferase [Oscillospiraceae bacterium]|nr:CDP-diacylglycerol--glycerol-3-phosphate 3-phosphatidyltransferase [Oscillospiraceae bacterium]
MNLANKLTLMRVILVVFFLFFIYIDIPYHFLFALIVFAGASITDALDGHIARKNNLITNFGKFLDPLADKVLVMAALAVFVEIDEVSMSAIPLIIIISREFMVSGLRLFAANSGVVAAAGMWGKLKTAFTMITIIGILAWLVFVYDFSGFNLNLGDNFYNISEICISSMIWISTLLTIISGVLYLKSYWHFIDVDK